MRLLHGESTAPTDAQIAREIAELRARIVSMLTALLRDEALANAFVGAAESLATWWLNQPQTTIDDATNILMNVAQATSSFDRPA